MNDFKNRIKAIVGKENFNKIYFITFLILLQSLVEVFGIAMIFPLISFFSDSQSFTFPENFNYLNLLIQNTNKEKLSIIIISIFISIFFIKFLIQSYVAWYSLTYFNKLRLFIAKKIIQRHFSFFDKNKSEIKDSAQFSNLVLLESERYSFKYIGCLINLSAEIITIIFISLLLFFASDANSILILMFYGFVIFTIYLIIKNYLKKIGEKRILHNEIALMNAKDGFAGFKEIVIYDAIEKYIKNFTNNFFKLINIVRNESFLQHLPRLFIELLTISIFCIVISFVFLVKKLDFNEIAPVLALYAFAALRIYPAVTRILANLSALRVSLAVEKKLFNFLNVQENHMELKNKTINFENKISIIDLSYTINDKCILDNVNLEIKKNEFIGIYGESGTGKSTFLNLLMGFLKPNSGKIKIDENYLNDENLKSWISKICYVGQNILILNDTIENNIALSNSSLNGFKLTQSIKLSQLQGFFEKGNSKKNILSEGGENISGGERQRLAVARAFYKDADVLFLDEATSSLDEETSGNLLEAIKKFKGKKTIFFISHKRENLEDCDKIIELKNKKIFVKN